MSTVVGIERKISQYLCKWPGLPRSLSSIAMYRWKNSLILPFRSVKEEFMVILVIHTREVWQYRESRDLKVSAS